MSNKKDRLSELEKINPIGAVDHRNHQHESGRQIFEGMPRSERRKIASSAKKLGKKYNNILANLKRSGAKFPADKILRELAIEYTHRYASSGIYSQPISFNYFEPFLHIKLIDDAAPYAEIEKEFNHLFYTEDFFEYITSPEESGFQVSSLLELPQDQIYHFSVCGKITDISFLYGEGREFVVAGFSIIRRGSSLFWYLIGGESLGEEEWKLRCSEQPEMDIESTPPWKKKFLEECLAESGSLLGKPIPLESTETYIRTIISGEFDLKEEKHLSRCYLAEYENSFDVICDDPEVFDSMTNLNNKERILGLMLERFDRTAVLWSLAEGLFQLPAYFNSRLALNKEVQANSKRRISRKKGGKGLKGDYMIIPSLEPSNHMPDSVITTVNLPHYEIETEGHWRKLTSDDVGVDRHGNSVWGRSWISSSSKWKPSGPKEGVVIYLKDTLSSARLKISEYLHAAEAIKNIAAKQLDSDEGELYVLRCSAMKEQIFKVGYTRGCSYERAKQLSSATGVPLAFVVVQCWKHKEARRLETEVHMMLSPYRLNNGREFFEAKFETIEKVVSSVLNEVES